MGPATTTTETAFGGWLGGWISVYAQGAHNAGRCMVKCGMRLGGVVMVWMMGFFYGEKWPGWFSSRHIVLVAHIVMCN